MSHTPSSPPQEHRFRPNIDYLVAICEDCGAMRSTPGTMVADGRVLRHDQRANGCRGCNRQYTHKMPHDLDLALEEAAFQVGRHHGELGLPEWTMASKPWFAQSFYLAAYEAGYRQGEAARVAAEAVA